MSGQGSAESDWIFDEEDGFLGRLIHQTMGELDGTNKKKEAQWKQDQVDKETAARKLDRENQLRQAELDDRNASSSAAALRNTGAARGRASTQTPGAPVNPEEKDFLGL